MVLLMFFEALYFGHFLSFYTMQLEPPKNKTETSISHKHEAQIANPLTEHPCDRVPRQCQVRHTSPAVPQQPLRPQDRLAAALRQAIPDLKDHFSLEGG